MPKTNVKVQLIGKDGNAFNILYLIDKALKKAGHKDLAKEFFDEATKGDYDHLLATACDYVEVC